MSRRV